MSADLVLIERRGAVTVLSLNRPPANAIGLELAHAVEAAMESEPVREAAALVLTGTGSFFSGGLDLRRVPTYTQAEQREFLGVLNGLVGKLYACPVPVVAAVNGHAVAGAFILALTADYRIGPTGTASFGLTEARVGIPFPAVPMIVLHAECPPQDVRYITLFARTFGSDEALRRGIFDELQRPQAVLERAIEIARDMAGMPADGYRRIKHQVREAAIEKIQAVISSGTDPMLEQWISPQAQDASMAVLKPPGKRKPGGR